MGVNIILAGSFISGYNSCNSFEIQLENPWPSLLLALGSLRRIFFYFFFSPNLRNPRSHRARRFVISKTLSLSLTPSWNLNLTATLYLVIELPRAQSARGDIKKDQKYIVLFDSVKLSLAPPWDSTLGWQQGGEWERLESLF